MVLELISNQLGRATKVVVAGLDELRRLLWVFRERCKAHAFLRQAEVVGGAQALCDNVLGLWLRRIGVRIIITICRTVVHGRQTPTDLSG